jgi:hypothetical protein
MSVAHHRPLSSAVTQEVVTASLVESAAEALLYLSWPKWARAHVDKWKTLFLFTSEKKGREVRALLILWNDLHPDCATSYSNYRKKMVAYRQYGITALCPRYGRFGGAKARSAHAIKDFYFDTFKTTFPIDFSRTYPKDIGPMIERIIGEVPKRKQ